MLENSLIKILTSICFCEERGNGRGGMEEGGMEEGGMEEGVFRDINCPMVFLGGIPDHRLAQSVF